MMKTKEQDRHWHLVRNDNGEWISDENVVFLTEEEARHLQIMSRLAGKQISIQHGYDGDLWCYKHDLANLNNIPMDKKGILNKIQKVTGYDGIKFPAQISFSISGKTLVIHISGTGVRDNMQTDGSAFEGWAISLLAWLPEDISQVMLNWDDPEYSKDEKMRNKQEKHYNRFVMRAMFFEENFEWAFIDESRRKEIDEVKRVIPLLVINYPKSDSKEEIAENEKVNKGEAKLERQIVNTLRGDIELSDHQLPVGLFRKEVNSKNNFTPRGASQIDIWQLENDVMRIFELKDETNNKIGIISELLFYANTISLLVKGKIRFPDSLKLEKNNYRHIQELSSAIEHHEINYVEAVFLNYSFHPLIGGRMDRVLSILNLGMKNVHVVFKHMSVNNMLCI